MVDEAYVIVHHMRCYVSTVAVIGWSLDNYHFLQMRQHEYPLSCTSWSRSSWWLHIVDDQGMDWDRCPKSRFSSVQSFTAQRVKLVLEGRSGSSVPPSPNPSMTMMITMTLHPDFLYYSHVLRGMCSVLIGKVDSWTDCLCRSETTSTSCK